MKRIRLAALGVALLSGLVAGCSSMGIGNGQLMSRMRGNHNECPCELAGGGACASGCCDGPPLGDGMAGPLLPPPTMQQPAVPALTPAPNLIPPSQPLPASPSSRIK